MTYVYSFIFSNILLLSQVLPVGLNLTEEIVLQKECESSRNSLHSLHKGS